MIKMELFLLIMKKDCGHKSKKPIRNYCKLLLIKKIVLEQLKSIKERQLV